MAKTISVPAEIRTNSEAIAMICQKMHGGEGYEPKNNLDLWSIINREIKTLESEALKFEFKPKDENDSKLKEVGKMAYKREIEL